MKYRFLRYPEGKSKAVTFSYDDGARADLHLLEILDRYGMKCTLNLCSDIVKEGTRLTKEEIEQHMLAKGHEIAVHGASHKANGQIRPLDGIREVLECRTELEQFFGRIIRGMAYPDTGIRRYAPGTDYPTIKQYLTDLEIAYARTLAGDNDEFLLPTDWHAWMPTAHHNNPAIFDYIKKFVELDVDKLYISGHYPRLFYIWGHSHEFEREGNWDRLEKICEELGGREDTWYATNMEIYEYVKAYEALVFSADNSLVYNPTLHTIWFDMGQLYAVKPGETLVLDKLEK